MTECLGEKKRERPFFRKQVCPKSRLSKMVQNNSRDVDEPLISDQQDDLISYGDIAREFSIMGWIGFGGEWLGDGRTIRLLSKTTLPILFVPTGPSAHIGLFQRVSSRQGRREYSMTTRISL